MQNLTIIDVIIPCYNIENTLARTIDSVIHQPQLNQLWLINDASTDNTAQIIQHYQTQFPHKIQTDTFSHNKGVAHARNWGAICSQADYIAFLDADDRYQPQVLEACAIVFAYYPHLGLIRLPMLPINLPEHYATHPDFATAWRTFEMTAGSNVVFQRHYFLALGGFPTHSIFKQWGGEDGALGLATVETCQLATLFENDKNLAIAVEYLCHEKMHARHLLDALLFPEKAENRSIPPADLALANHITQQKIAQSAKLQQILNFSPTGKLPLILS